MKRLAIIPARSGSKRIPHKNTKDFCGMPMVMHPIKAAEKSGLFDIIHVSTDDQSIADIASKASHAPDFLRPENLSGDHAPMMEAVRYVVDEYKKQDVHFDTVFLIYATSPLIDPKDIKKSCAAFEQSDKQKAYLAITPYPAPIEHAFRLNHENANITPDNAEALSMRTQDLNHAYYDAGMFAIYTPDYIKNSQNAGNFNSFRGYEVPSYRVTDIDWPEDWERAENLYRALNNEDQ